MYGYLLMGFLSMADPLAASHCATNDASRICMADEVATDADSMFLFIDDAEDLIRALAAGQRDSVNTHLSAGMRRTSSANQLIADWQTTSKAVGGLKGFGSHYMLKNVRLHTSTLVLEVICERGVIDAKIVYDDDDDVSAVTLESKAKR